jgi:hypothetical protein
LFAGFSPSRTFTLLFVDTLVLELTNCPHGNELWLDK